MGFNQRIIEVLDYARQRGADFSTTAMIGRQQLHMTSDQWEATSRSINLPNAVQLGQEIFSEGGGYAEPLLRALGANTVDSVDASDYEHANLVVDMNRPVDPSWHDRYTMVIDGGSLEHIFNFPTAVKNCMQMTQVGGHFFSINGTNHFSGHGFYQFSPELMYRVLSPENGFEVVEMLVWERTGAQAVYRVADPKTVQSRVMVETTSPTFLTVIAKRIHRADIFATTPQQSDYVADWSANSTRVPLSLDARPEHPLKRFGKQCERQLRSVRRRLRSRYKSGHFEPVNELNQPQAKRRAA